MFISFKRNLQRTRFNLGCRALLDTSPLPMSDSSFTLVSMICHGEVLMYLLAAKSFCQQIGASPAVVLLDDGSLTQADYKIIHSQIPHARIVHISEVVPADCPKKNCWERLLLISDIVKDSYVVQLDSDTLTMRSIDEIKQCIQQNRSFTLLGDRSYPHVESMRNAAERSKNNTSEMVQAVCERNFALLSESDDLMYVRGNAGFNGFAKGSIDREKIEWFSHLMRRLAKNKWDEWGSEQVTANLLIANAADAFTLPAPKYVSHWAHADVPYGDSAFIHFIGPFRFANGLYLKKAKSVIRSLPKG